jgi:asparaginase
MKKILILHTGGTIGMVPGKKGEKALQPSKLHTHFLDLVPELSEIAKIKTLVLDNIDSSNVTPKHWARWIRVLKENYSRYDGFVITHGTDSMAFTGAALSFSLKKINKPIVLTGSQRPLAHIRTDARDNLINSVEMACFGPKEISVCFGNELFRANRTTKLSATDYVAFESFNFPRLAKIGLASRHGSGILMREFFVLRFFLESLAKFSMQRFPMTAAWVLYLRLMVLVTFPPLKTRFFRWLNWQRNWANPSLSSLSAPMAKLILIFMKPALK